LEKLNKNYHLLHFLSFGFLATLFHDHWEKDNGEISPESVEISSNLKPRNQSISMKNIKNILS